MTSNPAPPVGTGIRPVVVALVLLLVATGAVVVAVAAQALASTVAASGLTSADGVLPSEGRTTVHDVDQPAIANLDPDLLAAVQRAADDAAADGVDVHVTSGWRSPELQAQLVRDAVADYGSEAEAARWVAPPHTSAHVSGDAIDLGDFDAYYWLGLHGAAYGLCPVYANEPWHFELRPDAVSQGCPQMYADPTEDPRLQS